MNSGEATTATGGSASSQASTLDRRSWSPRPWASRAIRAAILLVPFVAGVAAVQATSRIVERPSSTLGFWLWMAALVAVSTLVATSVHRLTRRLAPLGALLTMSLVFPDEAPSRFRTALRAGSTRTLKRRLSDSTEPAHSDQLAAENLLDLLARLNSHDRLTRGHCERVRAYSVMLGEEIGLSDDELEKLNWAALIHDVGKLEVDAAILTNPERPNNTEWAVLRAHPGAGAKYVEPMRGWLGDWVDATTQHHERWDGGGYPSGLAGTDISLAGRIVAIADSFDVMTATRSYKKSLPAGQARVELRQNAGTQFDPTLVRSFLKISVGRMRWVVGPMGWLTHFPDVIRTPFTVIASSGGTVVAAGAVAIAATAGLVAPTPTATDEGLATAAERTISEPAEVIEDDPVSSSPETAPSSPTVGVEPPVPLTDLELDPPTTTTTALPSSTSTSTPVLIPTTTTPTTTSTTAVPTTTALPNTTTTAGPTTTTSTTTTTTTASPTTTTAAPPTAYSFLMGGGGSTTAQDYLPLDASLSSGTLENYDTDRDSDAGLLVQVGTGITETDPTRMQRWFGQTSGSFEVSGQVTLEIWVALKDFDTAKSGRLDAAIYDCQANKTDCQLLASGSASFDQSTFGADFGRVAVSIGSVGTTIGANRSIMLKVAVPASSGDDLWLAYGTTTYPSVLNISG